MSVILNIAYLQKVDDSYSMWKFVDWWAWRWFLKVLDQGHRSLKDREFKFYYNFSQLIWRPRWSNTFIKYKFTNFQWGSKKRVHGILTDHKTFLNTGMLVAWCSLMIYKTNLLFIVDGCPLETHSIYAILLKLKILLADSHW